MSQHALHRDAYRFLDANHQLIHHVGNFRNRALVFTFNRRRRDYSERDVQIFELVCRRMRRIARAMEEWEELDSAMNRIHGFVGAATNLESNPRDLSVNEVNFLRGLIQGHDIATLARRNGIRRDSADRALGRLREKLGLESTRQILAVFRELQTNRQIS